MKKYSLAIVASALGLCCQIDIARAQVAADTTLLNADVLAVPPNITATNTAGAHVGYTGVDFDATATLTGAGSITVNNNTTGIVPGVGTIYGIYSDNGGVLTAGGFSGNITVTNNRSAGALSSDNDVSAYGFTGSTWYGNLVGNMTVTAIAGRSTAGDAYAEDVYGISGYLDGNLQGTITLNARGSTANVTTAATSAYAYVEDVYGVDNDINGDLTGAIIITATGGTATATDDYAGAYIEDIYGVDGEIYGDLTGAITINATAGSATSTNGDAEAYVEDVYGVYGGIDGNLSGTITINATAGTANATNGDANAYVYDIYGADYDSDELDGNLSGAITVNATAGTAKATDGYAGAYAEEIYGYYYDIYGNLTGSISVTAKAGTATSTNDTADAYVYDVYGAYYSIYGDLTGTLSVIATAGTAKATQGEANAYVESVVGIDDELDGDLSGIVVIKATAGTASSTGSDEANAYVEDILGIGYNDDLIGDLEGSLTVTAIAGTATANNDYAYAYAESVYGIGYGSYDLDGNLSGSLKVTAKGGTATGTDGAEAYVSEVVGIDYDLDGNLTETGEIQIVANAGTATSKNGYAYAYAQEVFAVGYDGNSWYGSINGDLAGTISLTATGGTAVGESADAYVYYIGGVGNEIDGDLSGTLTVYAKAGSATATDGDATAYADFVYGTGYDDYITGNLTGDVSVTAIAGTATATNGDADAYVYEAYGLYYALDGSVGNGDITGTITVYGIGGTATVTDDLGSSEANAYVDYIQGTDDYVNGDISGSITVYAKAGIAEVISGTGSAYAYADNVFGITGGMGGDLTGTMTITSIGGTATSANSDADAYVYAYGVDGALGGDLTGNIYVTAIGGTAEALNGTADASVYAYGVDDDVNGSISGTIKVIAKAGLENGVTDTDTEAYGINATGGDLTFDGATISAQAFEYDGTLIADNSYAIDGAGDLFFNSGINNITGDIYAVTANISDGTTANLNGRVVLSGGLNVGNGSTLGLNIGRVGLPANTVMSVATTATFGTSSTITLTDAVGAELSSVEGQVIVGAGTLNGYTNITIEDKSIFDFTVTEVGETIVLSGATVAQQNSPATGVAQANTASANKVMHNASKNLVASRRAIQGAGDSGDAPEGPSGPPAEGTSDGPSVKAGEWIGYISQYNDMGNQDSEGAKAGYDWQSSGYGFGVERVIQNNFIIGFTAGQSFSDIDGDRNSGDGDSEMLNAALYGTLIKDNKYFESGLFLGMADNDTNRIDIGLNGYRGNYDSTHIGAWFETGFTYKETKDTRIEPYVRASYVSGDSDGFTDAGGPIPMTVASNTTNNLIIESGARFTKTMPFYNGTVIHAQVNAALQAELLDNSVYFNTVIAGTGQRVSSPDSDPVALVLGLGFDWDINDQLTVTTNYEPTLSGNWFNHSLDFSVRYEF